MKPGLRMLLGWSLGILALAGFGSFSARAAEIGYTVYVCPPDVPCSLPNGYDQPPVPVEAIASDVNEVPLLSTGSAVGGSATAGARSATASVVQHAGSGAPPSIGISARFSEVADGMAVAFAFAEDELTLTSPSRPIGSILTITASFRVDGTIRLFDDFLSGGQSAEWIAALSVNGNGLGGGGGFCQSATFSGDPECPGADYSGTPFGPPGNVVTIPFQVANGVQYVQRLVAWTDITGYLLRGDSDFSSTIGWVSIEVRDASNEPVIDYTLSSASGIDWTLPSASPAPVPAMQPTVLYLLLPGSLIAIGLLTRRLPA